STSNNSGGSSRVRYFSSTPSSHSGASEGSFPCVGEQLRSPWRALPSCRSLNSLQPVGRSPLLPKRNQPQRLGFWSRLIGAPALAAFQTPSPSPKSTRDSER